MTDRSIELRIEDFIRDRFRVSPEDDGFGRDVDLFEHGYIDSLGLAELYTFLESEFGMVVTAEVVASDEFMTISGIADVVARRMAAPRS